MCDDFTVVGYEEIMIGQWLYGTTNQSLGTKLSPDRITSILPFPGIGVNVGNDDLDGGEIPCFTRSRVNYQT